MFPTSSSETYRNETGEILGWSDASCDPDYFCDMCGFSHPGDCEPERWFGDE